MTLAYVPAEEMERLRELRGDPVARAAAFADAARINALYAIVRAGSGHVGASFSALDTVSWLHLEVLREGDRYFSSKGHDAPGLYAVLTGAGRLPFEALHGLRRLDGLPGHPDVAATPEVHTSTGSLGMGVSKAKGFVLTGDGELQEGQFWESLPGAANEGMGEITVVVDHNRIQSDTFVDEVSPLGDVQAKAEAFGWAAGRCDGNDVGALAAALDDLLQTAPDRPKLLVADTRKGAGVSFMERHQSGTLYRYHSGAPSPQDYQAALDELTGRLSQRLASLGADPVRLASVQRAAAAAPAPRPQRLVAAYARALTELGALDERVVALDADLVLDCGLIPFRERFPERFIECGIAEQDMVSQAGTMALAGLIPVCHSFACFLSTRPNEQIYNNSCEGTRVVYVGSLAGLLPGGPGHSHQSVRDIGALAGMPGMTLVEPSWEAEVDALLRWALFEAPGPAYLRLVSVPWELGFEPPQPAEVQPGRGTLVRQGGDAVLIAAGPVMLSSAWSAALRLAVDGIECTVLALPWLRGVDGDWLAELAGDGPVFCLDNHYPEGGQGEAVASALGRRVHRLAVEGVPRCGTNQEVLRAHRLDPESVADRVGAQLRVAAGSRM